MTGASEAAAVAASDAQPPPLPQAGSTSSTSSKEWTGNNNDGPNQAEKEGSQQHGDEDAQLGEGEEVADKRVEESFVSMYIYPPAGVDYTCATPVLMESIPTSEMVASLRQTLTESPETCYISSYKLLLKKIIIPAPPAVLDNGDAQPNSEGEGQAEGMLAEDKKLEMEVEMGEFAELHSFKGVEHGAQLHIHMVLEAYTVRSARMHTRRLRELLSSPPAIEDRLPGWPSGQKGDGEYGGGGGGSKKQRKKQRQQQQREKQQKQQHQRQQKKAAGEEEGAGGVAEGDEDAAPSSAAPLSPEEEADKAEAQLLKEEEEREEERKADLKARLKEPSIPVGGKDGLGRFYEIGLGLSLEEVAEQPKPTTLAEGGAEVAASAGGHGGQECVDALHFSGWNPPPPQRRLMGDLLYIQVSTLSDGVLHITSTPEGFYVNRSYSSNVSHHSTFNPLPAEQAHRSHELLTCLLRASPSFLKAWKGAVGRATQRMTEEQSPQETLANMVRDGKVETVTTLPQWNVSVAHTSAGEAGGGNNAADGSSRASGGSGGGGGVKGRKKGGQQQQQQEEQQAIATTFAKHKMDLTRMEEDLLHNFGMDERGPLRDWNEEFQGVKEWPSSTEDEGIVKARALHKVMQDFHEAAIQGAAAIVHGHISPINPHEASKSHVFVFNNIFFSSAVDARDAYKAVHGDAAAHRSALHDLNNAVMLSMVSTPELQINTPMASVIDYMGHRWIAQSIIPGILQGDHAANLVCGAVEHGKKLKMDKRMLGLLRGVASRLRVAEREVEIEPIKAQEGMGLGSEEEWIADRKRIEEEEAKLAGGRAAAEAMEGEGNGGDDEDDDEDEKEAKERKRKADEAEAAKMSIRICGPVELKGIEGADKRRYLLDVTRLTPRDANWVSGEKGTGQWGEDMLATMPKERADRTEQHYLEYSALLRRELVAMFTRYKVSTWAQRRALELREEMAVAKAEKKEEETKEEKKEKEKEEGAEGEGGDAAAIAKKEEEAAAQAAAKEAEIVEAIEKTLQDEEEDYLTSLTMNVNVFMPYAACLDAEQEKKDEELVKEASLYLWEQVLPSITNDVKRGTTMPVDGGHLRSLLHSLGINMRYLGRLATMAADEEEIDTQLRVKEGKQRRHVMPVFWRELLETEMVARGAKYVLGRLFTTTEGARAVPGPLLLDFVNGLLGARDGGAGDGGAAAVSAGAGAAGGGAAAAAAAAGGGGGGGAAAAASRVRVVTQSELWKQIKAEVKYRFKYDLSIWGSHWDTPPTAGDEGATGGGSKASERAHRLPLLRRVCQKTGLRVASRTYDWTSATPFAEDDVVDIRPVGRNCQPLTPYPEATQWIENAKLHLQASNLGRAFELAQQATSTLLAVCSGLHSEYAAGLELMAVILYKANDMASTVMHEEKAITYYEQLEGFDSPAVISCHEHLAVFYLQAGEYEKAFAHLRAHAYLIALTAGEHHPSLCTAYLRMGNLYQELGQPSTAMRCYQEALSREAPLAETSASIQHGIAQVLSSTGHFKEALTKEKHAFTIYKTLYGEKDSRTMSSQASMVALTTKAVEVANESMQLQQAKAAAAANKKAGSGGSSSAGSNSRSNSGSSGGGGAKGGKGGKSGADGGEVNSGAGAGGEGGGGGGGGGGVDELDDEWIMCNPQSGGGGGGGSGGKKKKSKGKRGKKS